MDQVAVSRHSKSPEVEAMTLDEIASRFVGRFVDKVPDWNAFEDAKIEGFQARSASFHRCRRVRQAQ